jgi:ribosome maturation factor RimP
MPDLIEERLLQDLEPVLHGMGLELVELRAKRVKETYHVVVTVFRAPSVGLEDCATAHRTILPRIEMLMDSRDVRVEVTSPGISRKIKSNREFHVFAGKGVRILLDDEDEWIGGVILGADEHAVRLELRGRAPRSVPYSKIRKAKLDHTEEED